MVGYTVASTRPCNLFQCSSDSDCSGNGACDPTSSTCKCSSGYSGPSCNIRRGPCGSASAPGPSRSAPAPAPTSPSGLPELCCETGIVDHHGNCCESGTVPVAFSCAIWRRCCVFQSHHEATILGSKGCCRCTALRAVTDSLVSTQGPVFLSVMPLR